MPDHPLPKKVFFDELSSGDRSRGRPRKRYKDTLKVALKRCDMEAWKGLIKRGVSEYEQQFMKEAVDKCRRWKERAASPLITDQLFPCPHCNCRFRAPFVVVSHLRTHALASMLYDDPLLHLSVNRAHLHSELELLSLLLLLLGRSLMIG